MGRPDSVGCRPEVGGVGTVSVPSVGMVATLLGRPTVDVDTLPDISVVALPGTPSVAASTPLPLTSADAPTGGSGGTRVAPVSFAAASKLVPIAVLP